jgi:putative ABC transport system permease protein
VAGMNGDRDREEDLAREIRAHLELETEERVAEGSSPEDARFAARRAFGNITRIREEARAIWTTVWLDQAHQDLRHALRMCARTPGFTAVALLTFALGIGATTAIFSVVHAILLRPLPFPDSDRVVRMTEEVPPAETTSGRPRRGGPLRVSDLPALRSKSHTLSHVGAHIATIRTVTSREGPVRLVGVRLSPDLLAMLQTPPLLGRVFGAEEDAPGAEPVVILSYAAWQRYFGGDRNLVGRTIRLDDSPHTVIGVMDPSFAFPGTQDEFWMPLTRAGPLMNQRLPITARLGDGVSLVAGQAEISALVPALRGEPQVRADGASVRVELVPLLQLSVTPIKPALVILSAAVGFVLLIACANVANLLLARAAARRREYAMRVALGADQGRLIRQALAESTLLALGGGIVGIALAFGGVRLLRVLGASLPRRDLGGAVEIPRLAEVGIDGTVLLFTLAIATMTGMVCGLLPALSRDDVSPTGLLRHDSSGAAGFSLFRSHHTQSVLVAGQIALAIVLFVGGALMIQSLVKLVRVDPGYETRHVLTFQLSLPPARPVELLRQLADRMVARLDALPGVRAAGYAESLPMTRVSARPAALSTTPRAPESPPPPFAHAFTADHPDARLVSRNFLSALGVSIVEGRGFREPDRSGAPRVMLMNRTLARSAFVGGTPIGKRFYALGMDPVEVVGIVEDVRQTSLIEAPAPQIFLDFRQFPLSEPLAGVGLYFAVRTEGAATLTAVDIRRIVHELDPQLTLEYVAPMEALVSNSVARPRLYAVLLGVFAVVALALATIGIYGVVSYAVTQRTREIGVHMALGATRADVARLVLRQSIVAIAAGVVAGMAGAGVLTRYLDQLLFGLIAFDPATYAAAALVFGVVAAAATYIPTRRAVRVDPLVALRTD